MEEIPQKHSKKSAQLLIPLHFVLALAAISTLEIFCCISTLFLPHFCCICAWHLVVSIICILHVKDSSSNFNVVPLQCTIDLEVYGAALWVITTGGAHRSSHLDLFVEEAPWKLLAAFSVGPHKPLPHLIYIIAANSSSTLVHNLYNLVTCFELQSNRLCCNAPDNFCCISLP